MRPLINPTLRPQDLVARLNYGMAVFYGLLGGFGLLFVGDVGHGQSGAGITYLALVLALVGAHMTLGRYARRGATWARFGSLAGGLLLAATGYFGVIAGPILGLAIVWFCLKPWDTTGVHL